MSALKLLDVFNFEPNKTSDFRLAQFVRVSFVAFESLDCADVALPAFRKLLNGK